MQATSTGLIAVSVLLSAIGFAGGADPKFVAQTLDDRVEIGYGLAIGDVDGDGVTDILLADKREIVWYQNPGSRSGDWKRHLMVRDLTEFDNVCLAARDLDGDGRVEVAVGANWNPGETSDAARSGAIFFLRRGDNPAALWRSVPLTPHDPTTHRMHWVLWQANDYRLMVLPLHGQGNRNGEGAVVRLMAYRVPLGAPEQATAEVVYENLHMTHNFDVEVLTENAPEQLWVGGREGISLVSAQQQSPVVAAPPSAGVGELRRLQVTPSARSLAAIESMHGNELVFYVETAPGQWRRQVLDNSFNQGHALATGDLLALGRDQIVAGWRNPNAQNRVGIRLYVPDPTGANWQSHVVDDNQMACEDLRLADFDADGRLDIVAAGRATNNLIVYWNDSSEPR